MIFSTWSHTTTWQLDAYRRHYIGEPSWRRKRIWREKAAAASALTEMIGDLPFANLVRPPENILFVCKLNPVTRDDGFSRLGPIMSCQVIIDTKRTQNRFDDHNILPVTLAIYFFKKWGMSSLTIVASRLICDMWGVLLLSEGHTTDKTLSTWLTVARLNSNPGVSHHLLQLSAFHPCRTTDVDDGAQNHPLCQTG